jgi:NADPH-dependent glutamate synthase beta subunit-like oxidoreductase
MLGNPPWEVSQFSDKEFFAIHAPSISALPGAQRKQAIEALKTNNQVLWRSYQYARQLIEKQNNYVRGSRRFVLSAHGKTVGVFHLACIRCDDKFKLIPGTEFELKAELVLLAMGFVGPERPGLLEQLGVTLTDRGNVKRDEHWMTNVPGVFTAGDMQRGQSLIVWAIAEGRSAARGVDRYLMGRSDLPAPLP